MSANTQPQKLYVLKVIRGPDKGAIFKLIGRKVRIGRGPDNDVILTDPKCSRSHAIIIFADQTILIENLSTNSPVEIDGNKKPKAFLSPGSTIALGGTQIHFEEMAMLPTAMKNQTASMPSIGISPLPLSLSKVPQQKNKSVFYALIAFIVIAAAWLANQDSGPTSDTQLLTDADIDQQIDSSKTRQEEIYRQQTVSQKNTQQYQEANAAYLQGLRDYREGHYARALQSFSAALAIFPNHELAQNYYNLSKKRHDELVQFTFNEAQRYMEQNKYKEAEAAFQNVMILINDPNNKVYQEAREKYNEVVLIIKSTN